jgi:hypothetical protein
MENALALVAMNLCLSAVLQLFDPAELHVLWFALAAAVAPRDKNIHD